MCQISINKDCYGVDCEMCPFDEKLIKEQKMKKRIANAYISVEKKNIQMLQYNDELWNE